MLRTRSRSSIVSFFRDVAGKADGLAARVDNSFGHFVSRLSLEIAHNNGRARAV
jgi:hypothetical protein